MVMDRFIDVLEEKPVIGFISSVGAFILPFMKDIIIPACQYAGVLIGLAIGITTLYLNILKIKERKNNGTNNDSIHSDSN